MDDSWRKRDIKRIFDDLYKLFAKDFLKHPREGKLTLVEYVDAGMVRCQVVQEEIANQFKKAEAILQKDGHVMPPEVLNAVNEEIAAIKEEVAQAAGYFKEQAQNVRSDEEEKNRKSHETMLELYNFAKEKRTDFGSRVKKLGNQVTEA